jgi:adenylate cyclase class 2
MKTEFEVKFYPIKKEKIITKLKEKGGVLVQSEVKTIIAVYNHQLNPQIKGHYVRVRDEGDKVRLSIKIHAAQNGSIADQKEIDTIVSNFNATVEILERTGLKRSGFQEKMRETWEYDGAEVVIDTWPGLETYIEIEAQSEEKVKQVAEELGCSWDDKIITSVVEIYMQEYGMSAEDVLTAMENLTFDHHPFDDQPPQQ